ERFQITADSKPCNGAPDAKSPPGIGAGEPKATAEAPLKSDAIGKPAPGKTVATKADTGKKDVPKKDVPKKEPAKDVPKKGTTTMSTSPAAREALASRA